MCYIGKRKCHKWENRWTKEEKHFVKVQGNLVQKKGKQSKVKIAHTHTQMECENWNRVFVPIITRKTPAGVFRHIISNSDDDGKVNQMDSNWKCNVKTKDWVSVSKCDNHISLKRVPEMFNYVNVIL